jgi:hypothetical protein
MIESLGTTKVVLLKFLVEKSFEVWWMQFCAFARVNKFAEALTKDFDVNNMPKEESQVLSADDDDEKKLQKAKDKNDLAMSYFSIAFQRPKDI